MLLRLVKGATTITLSGDGASILACTYVPRTPEEKPNEASALRGVAESATVIVGGTTAAILSQVRAIEALLPIDDVRRRAVGEPVYVEFRQEATGDIFRSEVFIGRVEWSAEPVSPWLASGAVEVTVLWERRWYWEDSTLRTVALSNGNGSGATSGLTIFNHDDGGAGHDNWVQIASDQISGVAPAGCQIQLRNEIGATRTFTKVFLALNALSDPANFVHIIEGESRASGGSIVSDVAYSGGQALSFTVGSGVTPGTVTFTWTLAASLLQKAAGKAFRVLARFAGGSGTTTARPEIRAADGVSVLWRGDVVSLPSLYGGLLDLGMMPLPPGGYATSYGALTLALTLTGVASRTLDFLQITPMDAFVLLEAAAGCGNAEALVYDSSEHRQYVLSGSVQLPYLAASGGEILLQPGVAQRLIVLQENSTGVNRGEISDALTVMVRYRPRRLTL